MGKGNDSHGLCHPICGWLRNKIDEFSPTRTTSTAVLLLLPQMASLARVKLARRLVCFHGYRCDISRPKKHKLTNRPTFFLFSLQPTSLRFQIRSVQTSADATQLHESPRTRLSPSSFDSMKTRSSRISAIRQTSR